MPKIEIRPSFILILAGITLMLGVREAAMTLLAAALHELGHIAAIYLAGGRVQRFAVDGAGASIIFDGALTPLADAAVSLSGPALSALGAVAGAALYEYARVDSAVCFAGVSALFCVINMLPMSPMDGGRALGTLMRAVFGERVAGRVCEAVDILGVSAFFVLGLYVFAGGAGNVTPLLCAILLCDACCKRYLPNEKSSVII